MITNSPNKQNETGCWIYANDVAEWAEDEDEVGDKQREVVVD